MRSFIPVIPTPAGPPTREFVQGLAIAPTGNAGFVTALGDFLRTNKISLTLTLRQTLKPQSRGAA
jgi:hypothetical protein